VPFLFQKKNIRVGAYNNNLCVAFQLIAGAILIKESAGEAKNAVQDSRAL